MVDCQGGEWEPKVRLGRVWWDDGCRGEGDGDWGWGFLVWKQLRRLQCGRSDKSIVQEKFLTLTELGGGGGGTQSA